MKIHDQTSAERTQLGTLLEAFSVAMMTSRDEQGALVSRPMSALEMDSEGALWFFTQKDSAKTDQLPDLNLSFSDRAASTYVSMSGHGRIHHNRKDIERLWTPFARPWFPEGSGSANLVLLRFAADRTEYWDGPSSTMVRLFAMAAPVVAGRPAGTGTHGAPKDVAER